MYAPTTTTLLAITALLTLTTSTPLPNPSQPQSPTPYFAIRNFTWSKSPTSSRYTLQISFPQDTTANTPDSSQATLIPGYTDPVACTGTWFYSGATGSNVTSINACGYVDGDEDSPKTIATRLDVGTGELMMVYTYREGVEFAYSGLQTGLVPVTAEAEEGFDTPVTGTGVAVGS